MLYIVTYIIVTCAVQEEITKPWWQINMLEVHSVVAVLITDNTGPYIRVYMKNSSAKTFSFSMFIFILMFNYFNVIE